MHLYISVSYFVCAVSLTHSLRLCKPHLARQKYIISRRLHWMILKLESFSHETTCLHATVSVRVAVTSLPAPLAIKGSARNRQDLRLTGRLSIRAGHAKNRLIPITGRSIGASLICMLKCPYYGLWKVHILVLGVPNNRLTCMQGQKILSLSYNMHLFLPYLLNDSQTIRSSIHFSKPLLCVTLICGDWSDLVSFSFHHACNAW